MNLKLTKISTVLLSGTLITRIAMFMSIPFLSIYLTNALNFSAIQAGYIVSINPLIIVLTSVFSSKISRNIGVKRMMYLAPIIWGTSLILFNYTSSFYMLLFLNGVTGFCYALYEPNSKYLLSLNTDVSNKLFIFNLRCAAINIGALLGPILGMVFNAKENLNSYVVLGIIYIILGWVNFFMLKEVSTRKDDSFKTKNHNFEKKTLIPFIIFLLGVVFSYFGYSQVNSTVSQYFANSGKFSDGIQLYSYTISASQLLVILFQLILLRFTKRIPSYKILILSNILLSLSLFLVFYSYKQPMWFLFLITYGLGELFLGSHLDYAIDQKAKPSQKTLYFSLAELIKMGSTLGPIVGSYFLESYSYQITFICLPLITLIGSLFILIGEKMTQKEKNNENF